MKNFLKIFKLSNVLIFTGFMILVGTYLPVFYNELMFYLNKNFFKKEVILERNLQESVVEGSFKSPQERNTPLSVEPINTDFSIVIEELNINAPVIRDVNVSSRENYLEALKNGVAHASFSKYPSSDFDANVYLFAHSSNNFWEFGKYSSVFNLLYKLKVRDEINVFFEGQRYLYQVENKVLVNDFRVDDTVFEAFGPTLTLQTCYPTGSTKYRLVLRASLVGIY
jgi:LPXTG-site transpeptidase (sortase) family protein